MTTTTALERFQEARSALAERASLHAFRSPGIGVCLALSDQLDDGLRELAEPVARPGFALVAVGGYGRREQCRHSDVDLMLLFDGEPEREAVDGVLYPLWDSGLKIGHSVRSVSQVAPAARENVETFTALLDARLVAGDEETYERFLDVRRRLAKGQLGWLLEELAAGRRARVEQEPWQLQDADVKNGRGSLRTLQALTWLETAEALAEGREPAPRDPQLEAAREDATRRPATRCTPSANARTTYCGATSCRRSPTCSASSDASSAVASRRRGARSTPQRRSASTNPPSRREEAWAAGSRSGSAGGQVARRRRR